MGARALEQVEETVGEARHSAGEGAPADTLRAVAKVKLEGQREVRGKA